MIENATGDLLAAGWEVDFTGDSRYTASLCSIRNDVPDPAKIRGDFCNNVFQRWNGTAWVEVAQADPMPKVMKVELSGVALTKDKVLVSTPQPSTLGWRMCDRDIKIRTSLLTDSFEDLKVNVATLKKENWNEVSLGGVYKLDGSGNYIPVVDQTDADSTAVLTVWNYQAKKQSNGTVCAYDVRGGMLSIDAVLVPPKNDHLAFVVAAPDIPVSYGGCVRFFDAYLSEYENDLLEVVNPQAVTLDPTLAAAASVLRVYIYHPPGAKQTHILRLIMYRKPDTF
jgi:hypothetical protein